MILESMASNALACISRQPTYIKYSVLNMWKSNLASWPSHFFHGQSSCFSPSVATKHDTMMIDIEPLLHVTLCWGPKWQSNSQQFTCFENLILGRIMIRVGPPSKLRICRDIIRVMQKSQEGEILSSPIGHLVGCSKVKFEQSALALKDNPSPLPHHQGQNTKTCLFKMEEIVALIFLAVRVL